MIEKYYRSILDIAEESLGQKGRRKPLEPKLNPLTCGETKRAILLLHKLLKQIDEAYQGWQVDGGDVRDWMAQIETIRNGLHETVVREKTYEVALEEIAGSHLERTGYDQTDINDVPDLTAEDAMKLARNVLSKA